MRNQDGSESKGGDDVNGQGGHCRDINENINVCLCFWMVFFFFLVFGGKNKKLVFGSVDLTRLGCAISTHIANVVSVELGRESD